MNGIKCELGPIAFAAEVAQVEMAQVGRHNLLGGIGGAFIGEMAVPAQDALLEAPGTMRAILKHFDVMIGFQQQDVRAAHPFKHQFRGMAEVRQHSNVTGPRLYQESYGIVGVMRHRKSLHDQVAEFEAVARREKPANEFGLELALERVLRRAIAINGDLELLGQSDQPLDVVVMLVRDQHTGQVFRRAANRCEALPNLFQREPRID